MTFQSTATQGRTQRRNSIRDAAGRYLLGTNSIVAVFADRDVAMTAREALVAAGGKPGYIVNTEEAAAELSRDRDLKDALRAHAGAGLTLLVLPEASEVRETIATVQQNAAECVYRRGRWITERIQAPVLG